MKLGIRILILATLAISGVSAQSSTPQGTVAFLGTDPAGITDLYVLDLATGKTGKLNAPVNAEADFVWQPSGEILAFTTEDGGYGLLRSLRGCFGADGLCTDIAYVIPPFIALQLEWAPDGQSLFFLTEEGIKTAPAIRARLADIQNVEVPCNAGIELTGIDPLYLLCAEIDTTNTTRVGVFELGAADLNPNPLYEIGTFPAVTQYDIGPEGQSAVGTLESGGDSGFFADPDGNSSRLATYQIHVYTLAFSFDGTQLALTGAIADSTGDGTLSDGDAAEFFLYDTASAQLIQVPGFTNATDIAWSPDNAQVLVVTEQRSFSVYSIETQNTQPLNAQLPDLTVDAPIWNAADSTTSTLPGIPTATPVATLTPFATLTPLPTLTPFPTFTPRPSLTPIPSQTPGSPLGSGCQYAFSTQPVNIGETAEVTQYGAAVRFRPAATLRGSWIAELRPGTRMTILDGPWCVDGYRWWQVRLADGRTGYLADGDQGGNWIQRVDTIPAESIYFIADRYSVNPGECVTLSWNVEGIRAVFYQGAGVTGNESRVECPTTTTTYTLTVTRQDNTNVNFTITVFVNTPY